MTHEAGAGRVVSVLSVGGMIGDEDVSWPWPASSGCG